MQNGERKMKNAPEDLICECSPLSSLPSPLSPVPDLDIGVIYTHERELMSRLLGTMRPRARACQCG